MKRDLKPIAKRLLDAREMFGLSQAEFCREIGVKKNVYNPFERGRRVITMDVALKVYQRFELPVEWIMLGDPRYLTVEHSQKLGAKTKKVTRRAA